MFGSTAAASQSANKPTSSNLFGNISQPSQQPAQQNQSLFGSTQAQAGKGPGLFGSSQPAQSGTSLFGSQSQNPQQNTGGGGGGGLFGSQQQQAQSQPQAGQTLGGFGSTTQSQQPLGGLGGSQSRLGGSSLWQSTNTLGPRERSIAEQMAILFEKWNPESSNCVFQHYFYNNVPPEHVPYYRPGPGEDEKKWEEALSKKPSEGSIPILGSGFPALAQRLRTQVTAVNALQARLHEINNSLVQMMQNHDLVISVRTAEAKRKHTVLGQRCLSLAAKVQVLRNRGYVMDAAEENLRKKLLQLETKVYDPVFSGRSEEIWARMIGLRERARILQEDTERTAKERSNGDDEGIDEEILKKTKKILNDYDAQLTHLRTELDKIRKDFESWLAATSGDENKKK